MKLPIHKSFITKLSVVTKFRGLERLNITAEGQTEERFVKQTISVHLGKFNISTDVRCVLTSKDKKKCYRGGLISYQKAKNDILTWLKDNCNHINDWILKLENI